MSLNNGHLPEGAIYATPELLLSLNTQMIRLPALSSASGKETFIRIQRVNKVDYVSCWPPLPAEAATWTPEHATAQEQAWLESLSVAERAERRRLTVEARYRLIALAAVQPALTWEQARQLGEDADALYQEILEFSGLLVVDPSPATPPTAPQQAEGAAAAA